jgi:hypothetical protein
MTGRIEIDWYPQDRQLTFLRACGLSFPFEAAGGGPVPPVADVIGYGGAAGGGKTDALLAVAMVGGLAHKGISIGYFRREFPRLEGPGGAIMRSQELMSGWCKWNGTNHRWTMPTGSILQFCHCAKETDVYGYQSQQFDYLLFDEFTEFTRFQVRYLITRNRATRDGVMTFTGWGSNPGQVGHIHAKTEYIEAGEWEQPHNVEVEPGEFERHIFIPSKLSDNQILEKRDPSYRRKLQAQTQDIRRALLDGDWDVFAGQYYPEWRRDIHVFHPGDIELPPWWKRFRSLDYGLDRTACYWWAVSTARRLYIYRELYKPNLTLTQAAAAINDLSGIDEKISYTVASPDLWNRRQDSGVPGEETMRKAGLSGLVRADDSRINGWRQLREYLTPYDDPESDPPVKTANLLVGSNCIHLIRTLPALVHDDHDVEDVSDKCEDHGPESIRYGVMSRPPASVEPAEQQRRKRARQKLTRPVVSSRTGY